jgi:hypothetical protein
MTATKSKTSKKSSTTATMTRKKSTRKRKMPMIRKIAIFVAACCVGLMVVSISHLSDALATLTHSATWITFAMAIVVDGGMIGSEMACIFGKKEAHRHAKHYLIGATALSMMLNCTSFCSHMAGSWYMFIMPVVLGISIPLGVLKLGSVAAKLWQNK